MHTRDYSEHTSRVIDDEVEKILRAQEERALEVLARHRGGLDAVARSLLDEETIDGETVGRLVDTAYGRPVHEPGAKQVPPIFDRDRHGTPQSTGAEGTGDQAPASQPADVEPAASKSSASADTGAVPAPAPPGGATPWPHAPAPWPPPAHPGGWPHQAPYPPPPPPTR
jgi:hypothetical protein